MKRFIATTVLMAAMAAAAFAQDAQKILKQLDDMQDFSGSDFAAVYTIVSTKPGEKDSVTQAQLYRRDTKDQFVMIILLPEVNKGQGYLREGDTIRFYDPTSRKFSFSSIKESIQDSEAKNSDLTLRSTADDYEVVSTTSGMLGKVPVWILDLKARTTEVSYERLVLYVRKDQTMLLKEEAYGVSGRLMRTTYFPKYVELGGKMLPSQILIVDELNPGERSQLTMTGQSVAPLPDYYFTKAFLEGKSK